MSDNDRRLKLWLYKNANQVNVAYLFENLQAMLVDAGVPEEYQNETPLFVFSGSVTPSRVGAILQYSAGFLALDNKRHEESGEVTGSYMLNPSLLELVDGKISGSLRRFLKIQKREKRKLSAELQRRLEGVLAFDFVGKTEDEQVELWRAFVGHCATKADGTLDMSGMYSLSPRVVFTAGVRDERIHSVLMNYNNAFTNTQFLFYFPGIKTFSAWYLQSMSDEGLENLSKVAPNLETVEFHSCPQLTGRVFLFTGGLKKLKNLVLNNQGMKFQPTMHEMVIEGEESWERVKNVSLTTLLVDSGNFTRDFMKELLPRLPLLSKCIVHKDVLNDLRSNTREGYEVETVAFLNVDNLNDVLHLKRDIRFFNLVKDRAGQMFSDSMLRKIKEIDPSKASAVDKLLS